MLNGLDDINWKKLGDAYGSAKSIPKAIRLLTSPDPEKWVGALDELYARLCHQQCTVYEATAPAVPVLVELLQTPGVRCRGGILELLGDIARAGTYLEAHEEIDLDDEDEDSPEYRRRLALEQEWMRLARQAVWKGLGVYLGLLSDFDPRLRVSVPYTLGLLVAHGNEGPGEPARRQNSYAKVSKALCRQLDEEPNELVRASLVFGLSAFARFCPENIPRLRKLVNPREDLRVRVAAAMCLAEVDPAVPVEAIQVLADALSNHRETDHLFDADTQSMEAKHHPLAKAYRRMGLPLGEEAGTGYDPEDVGADEDFHFPWLDGWPRFSYLNRLCRLGPKYEAQILPSLLAALRVENAYTVDDISAPILRYVFRGGKLPRGSTPETLSQAQRAVLQLLYDNPLLWATDSGNVECVFSDAGLPESRTAWRRLLGIKKRPTPADEAARILDLLVRHELNLDAGVEIGEKQWEKVKALNLSQLADDGFTPLLGRFRKLEKLDIGSRDITDRGLAALPDLPKLRELILCYAAVTDDGVRHVTRFEGLKRLNLYRTRVTDAGFGRLKVLNNLRWVFARGTKVSEKAAKSLRAALPKCKIERDA